LWARRRKIQLPYPNTHESIWEYKEAFLSGQIDFFSFLGPACPVCGKRNCYREITPYWRYAIDLFPQFKKERVPIARFLCNKQEKTFSILPTQLIPYFQYTVNAVIGTLLLGLQYRQTGQKGFHGASVAVDPDSLLTPWLIACWLGVVVLGLRRSHGMLRRWYSLTEIRSSSMTAVWKEAAGYFLCFGWRLKIRWGPPLHSLINRYSRNTRLFLFGTPSQYRVSVLP
jgi:hypothetical protein